jgi:hypothetical protein
MEERGKWGIVWGEGESLLCSGSSVCVCGRIGCTLSRSLFVNSNIDKKMIKKRVDRDLSRLDERAEIMV